MTLTTWQIELIPWYGIAIYWALTGLRVKPTEAREKSTDRMITLAGVMLGYTLLFANWLKIGPLRLRFVPQSAWITGSGIALTWLGAAQAIWARQSIGQVWSARVALKQGHRLIRSGPYAVVRHPIYTGLLVAAAGTALVTGEWRGVLAVALLLAAHSRKARREESLLTSEFGEQYADYRRSAGFLFPRLSAGGGMDTPGERS